MDAVVIPVLILGEHDKGTGEAFHPATVSGRRLRRLLAETGLQAEIGNVYLWRDGQCKVQNLPDVCHGYIVVALGRVAATECERQGITATYLPHPAVRSQQQLQKLKEGLRSIAERIPDET